MKQQADEIVLAGECSNGNKFAQKALYDRYADQMMLLCYRYITNRHDAMEVMLDAFYNCYKNIEKFEYRGEGSLGAWLRKIVVNQCLMHIRSARPAMITEISGPIAEEVSVDSGIFEQMSAKQILQLIHELPDGYRTVFNLYAFENKSHKEIAQLLGITEHTSKSQLHKAKAALQKKILNTD